MPAYLAHFLCNPCSLVVRLIIINHQSSQQSTRRQYLELTESVVFLVDFMWSTSMESYNYSDNSLVRSQWPRTSSSSKHGHLFGPLPSLLSHTQDKIQPISLWSSLHWYRGSLAGPDPHKNGRGPGNTTVCRHFFWGVKWMLNLNALLLRILCLCHACEPSREFPLLFWEGLASCPGRLGI